MNHIYRSIWNARTQTYVATSEVAVCRRAPGSSAVDRSIRSVVGSGVGFALRAVAAAGLLACGSAVFANPVGGAVSSGKGSLVSSGNTLTVTQSSQNMAINWQSFVVNSGESVVFVQPNASAIALNRVLGATPSTIMGNLSANGQVFLINPNGILFGQGATVNVQGLVASTLNLSDSDFLSGNYKFSGNSTQSVANLGLLQSDGGYVALVGATVSNQGTISARLGTVALVGGQGVTLDIAGDNLLHVQVDQGVANALVTNGGMIVADGGQVLMSTQAAGQLLNTVVNNTGVVQAQTVEQQGGVIKLLGDMQSGTVIVGGTLDASAPHGGNGGSIETSAAQVKVAPVALVTTAAAQGQVGQWLIDPADFTIASTASGSVNGSGTPSGDISGATLTTALASSNVTILSSQGSTTAGSGNINVYDTVTWSANTLTLTAANNINVGSSTQQGILNCWTSSSSVGAGSLVLHTATANGSDSAVAGGALVIATASSPTGGIAGGPFKGQINLNTTGSFSLNGVTYTIINSLGSGSGDTTTGTLQSLAASGNLAGHYVLGGDLDASATSGWSGNFTPIGSYVDSNANASPPLPPALTQSDTFSGIFNGLGHTITGLTISSTAANGTGMFGVTGGQTVTNIGNTPTNTVALISDVALKNPTVSGVAAVGALVGYNEGTINNSYVISTTGSVSGANTGSGSGTNYSVYVGGLVGENIYNISNSYASIATSSTNASVTNSQGAAQVAGLVGGLVGFNGGSVTSSSASGAVTGYQYIGGLVGDNAGTITSSSASGNVGAGSTGGGAQVGGLVGFNSGTVTGTTVSGNTTTFSFATGTVVGTTDVGGLVGLNEGSIALSYATGNVTGTSAVGGLVGANQGVAGGTGNQGTCVTSPFPSGCGNSTQSSSSPGTLSFAAGAAGSTGVSASITTSYSSSTVSGSSQVGGLVGLNAGGAGGAGANGCTDCAAGGIGGAGGSAQISQSYASGSVSGQTDIGGLVGRNISGATGTAGSGVTVTNFDTPGPAGSLGGGVTVVDTYASATVSGSGSNAGGLIGLNSNPSGLSSSAASVATSYATGTVGGGGSVQALAIGKDVGGAYNDVYYLTQGSQAAVGSGSSTGVSGLSSSQLASSSNFAGFGFTGSSAVWGLIGGTSTQPFLCALTTGCAINVYVEVVVPNTGSNSATVPYLTSAQTTYYGNGVPNFEDILVTSSGSAFTLPSGVSASFSGSANKATPTSSGSAVTPSITTAAGSYVVGYNTGGVTFSGGSNAAQTLVGSYVLSTYGGGMSWTVNQAPVTISAPTVTSKTYDGTSVATLSTSGLLQAAANNSISGTGIYASDASNVTLVQTSTGTFGSKNAGSNIPVSYADTLTGSAAGNYLLVLPSVTGTINQAPITVSGTTVTNKYYDGTAAAVVSGGTLLAATGNPINTTSGVLASDLGGVTLHTATSGTFASANASTTAQGVTVVDSISGSAAGNYTLVQPSLTGVISAAPLTVSGVTVATKTYDGTSAASLSGTATLVAATGNTISGGIYASDVGNVSLSTALTSGTFAGSSASTHAQAVTVSDTLTGSAAGNYVFVAPTTLTGIINPAPLVVSGTSVASKTYDGTVTASLSGGTLAAGAGNTITGNNGVYGSDVVTLTQSGTFSSANANASAQSVTAADSLSGSAASNYVLTQPTGLSAVISPASLTVTGSTVVAKYYNGSTVATVTGGILAAGTGNNIGGNGVLSADINGVTLTTASTGTFASANASTSPQNVTVADSLVLAGSAIGNYVLVQPTLTGMINPAPLTVSGLSVANKTYNGSNVATLSGTATLVAAPGNTIGGTGILTADATGVSLAATGTGIFASANASTSAQAVSVSDSLVLTGSAIGNYALTQPGGLVGYINAAPLVVSGTTVANKTYNGTTTATLSGGVLVAGSGNSIGGTGVYSGDSVVLAQTGNFASVNASSSAQAVVAADTLSGAGASNYVLTQPSGLSAVISAAPLTVSGTTVLNKTYNGTMVASVSGGTLAPASGNTIGGNGVLAADAALVHLVTASSGMFATPNASSNAQTVSVTDSLTLSGAASTNYVLVQPSLTAFINPAPLTATGTAVVNKTYDGSSNATLTGGTLSAASGNTIGGNGVLPADAANVAFTAATTGQFASANASANSQVVVVNDGMVLTGSAIGNYIFVAPTVSGFISPAPLTVAGSSVASKTYNGNAIANVSGGTLVAASGNTIGTTSGVLGSDAANVTLALAQTGTFASVNASAQAQAVSVNDSLSGSAAGNYVLVAPSLTGYITPAPLTVSGTTVATRTYNGSTAVNVSGGTLVAANGNTIQTSTGVLGSDANSVSVSLATTGAYATPNASSTPQSVQVIDTLNLTGAATGNYVLVQPLLSGLINQAPITVTGSTVTTKTYNGNTLATLSGGSFSPVNTGNASTTNAIGGNGVVTADLPQLVLTQAGNFSGANASSVAQSVVANDALSGAAAGNYVLVQPAGLQGFITPAPVTVANTVVASKIYNGGVGVNVSGGTLVAAAGNTIGGTGVLSADAANVVLTTVSSGTFSSANASASAQSVAVNDSIALQGSAQGNYVLVQPILTGYISPAPVTVTGTTVASKTYNGSSVAALSGGILTPASGNAIGGTGIYGTDAVTLTQIGNFAGVNASASPQAVTVADSLGGASAGNYVLVQPTGLSGYITPAPVTVIGTVVAGKTYNGSSVASLTAGTLVAASGNTIGGNGVLASDSVNVALSQSGNFVSANASASPQVVTASDTLTGTAASNYVLVQPAGLSAMIAPAPLTVVSTTAANKTYDGTTTAILSGGTLAAGTGNTIGGSGVLTADAANVNLQLATTGSFARAGASSNPQAVSVVDSLSGSASGNYVLVQPTGVTAYISPAPLTVVGSSVVSKSFDGTTSANLVGGSLVPVSTGNAQTSNTIATGTGVLASDAAHVSLNQSGSYASANVSATPQAVTVQDTLALSGSAAGNYVLVQPGNLSGTITPATLTLSAVSNTKTYDGTTSASAIPTVAGLVSGSSLSGLSESYQSVNVMGTGASTLGVNGNYVLSDGNGGANYRVVTQTATGTINPATLTVSNTLVANKIYDGTAATTLQGGRLMGVFNNDAVGLVQAGSYVSSNAAQNVAVVSSDSLTGSSAGNYVLQQPTGLTGNISPASVSVVGTSVASRPFDGSNGASLSGGVLQGVLPADAGNVQLNQSGYFVSPIAINSSPVVATDVLTGSAAANYSLVEPTGLSANISPNAQMPTAALLSVPLVSSAVSVAMAPSAIISASSGNPAYSGNSTYSGNDAASATGGAPGVPLASAAGSGSGAGKVGGVAGGTGVQGAMTTLPVVWQGLNVSIINDGINVSTLGTALH